VRQKLNKFLNLRRTIFSREVTGWRKVTAPSEKKGDDK